jgi:hypothetical protein
MKFSKKKRKNRIKCSKSSDIRIVVPEHKKMHLIILEFYIFKILEQMPCKGTLQASVIKKR